MSSFLAATTSFGTTGVKTIDVGFQPIGMRITVCQKFNTSQTFSHWSYGVVGSYEAELLQFCHSTFQDTTGGQSKTYSDRIVSHWERVAGTLTEKVAATFDSFTTTELKINVTTADANYQFLIEAWD